MVCPEPMCKLPLDEHAVEGILGFSSLKRHLLKCHVKCVKIQEGLTSDFTLASFGFTPYNFQIFTKLTYIIPIQIHVLSYIYILYIYII